MTELTWLKSWSFYQEVDVPEHLQELLIDGEKAAAAYKTVRDVAVITNKRILLADRQGMTGKKIEVYTIPFASINMYSTENAGTFDANAEIELWTKSGRFQVESPQKSRYPKTRPVDCRSDLVIL
ncbi:PH domain-containing protein [Planococcus sp. ISL-109]|uniref:PH domain-containing protein n=1 Tax=Planococcus sp. ISL-109 TaxID=2819166 RepID=UPI00333AE45C